MAFWGGCNSKAAAILILLNVIFFNSVFSRNIPCPSPPISTPSPPSGPEKPPKCPKDTLKFGVCGSWLGLVHEVVGTKPSQECCSVLTGVADLEAAICLCTVIKANVLGVVKLEVPVAISLLLNACGKKVPEGFKCP